MTVRKEITLEEAVQLFKTLSKELFLWVPKNNIVIPKNYEANTVFCNVVTCSASKNVYTVGLAMKEQQTNRLRINPLGTFENLDDLRKSFPQLFECTGELNTN